MSYNSSFSIFMNNIPQFNMKIYLIVLAAIFITVKSYAINSIEDNETIIKYREYDFIENHFATRLYKALAKDSPDNFVCSPLSAHIALAALAIGARGRVSEDIRTTLIDIPDNKNFERYEVNSSAITIKGNVNFFNQLFIQNDYKILPEYKKAIKIYRSGVTNVNFTDSEMASTQINNWCQIVTNGRISTLVSEASIYNTKLLVVNAVYFKAMWVNKFNSDTILRSFYVNGKSPKKIPMMYQRNLFNFGRIRYADAEYIRLPFRTGKSTENLNMYIIVPTKKNGLQKIEDNFHKINFTEYNNDKTLYNIDLYLPKFIVESTLNLRDPLKNLGLGSLFDESADFSGISSNIPLKVDQILQKTFIEVNEEGSEASTTSAVRIFGSAEFRHLGNLNFEVNCPFLITITSDEFVIFAGRVKNPIAMYY